MIMVVIMKINMMNWEKHQHNGLNPAALQGNLID